MDVLKKGKISGATMWTGMCGYGKRGKSDVQIEGITINMPLMIEIIDELEKLESVIPQIKELIDNNGMITLPHLCRFHLIKTPFTISNY